MPKEFVIITFAIAAYFYVVGYLSCVIQKDDVLLGMGIAKHICAGVAILIWPVSGLVEISIKIIEKWRRMSDD